MLRLFCFCLLFVYTSHVAAQMKAESADSGMDSLQVFFYKEKWTVKHIVKSGENIFSVSKLYSLPPAQLASINNINYQDALKNGAELYVPLGGYNQVSNDNRTDIKPLYYEVQQYDNLFRLAHLAGVQQRKLQEWNNMPDNYITEGQRLFVGWVKYDISDPEDVQVKNAAANNTKQSVSEVAGKIVNSSGSNDNTQVIVLRKGRDQDTLSEIEKLYNAQTNNGELFEEEKGTAVFYENKGKITGTTTFYAFHNKAPRGTIIKVYNPGTDKTIYVKVLGPMPNTKQYYNCVIGISSGAKEALMVAEGRTWCEIKYNPVQ
jgi:murein DD-endopeptidase MepM/ murein hydrolase activator NlpD